MPLWLEADVERLKAAISSGVLTVSYDGPPRRTITYQSLREMRDLLAEMVIDVAATAAAVAGPVPSFRRIEWNKGFERPGRRSWRRNE